MPLVEAETFPPRYRLHKYWGKKPANVIAAYVQAFTRPGERILDPFCGSGVTVAEAAIAGRSAVGIDLNPVAVQIGRTRMRPVPVETLDAAFERLKQRMLPIVAPLRRTDCRDCGEEALILSTVWERTQPVRVKTACGCRSSVDVRPITPSERRRARGFDLAPPPHPDGPLFFGWQMQKLARAGLSRFSDLFTPKNLYILAHLRQAISAVTDARVRDLLLVTFTANLAQCTRMIADFRGAGGGPSWKLNSYWVPKVWQELDPWHYFANRLRKTRAALLDVQAALRGSEPDARFFLGDAAEVLQRHVEPESIDFVFTDPPYGGEGIQYGELSMLWNLWLERPQRMEREIAFNPFQDKDAAFYERGLRRVFRKVHRALKSTGHLAVTFNNKESAVWEALMRACREAGFALESASPLARSAPAVTEKNAAAAPKVDVVLLFSKKGRRLRRREFSLDRSVDAAVKRLRRDAKDFTTRQVQDLVVCDWFAAAYEDETSPPALGARAIEEALRQRAHPGPAGSWA